MLYVLQVAAGTVDSQSPGEIVQTFVVSHRNVDPKAPELFPQ
jgi:hypothetical protein